MTGYMLWCSFYDVYEHASAEDKKTTMYSGDGEMGGAFSPGELVSDAATGR